MSNSTQKTKMPALIRLNAAGLKAIVLSYTIPYSGADPNDETDSIEVVRANILPKSEREFLLFQRLCNVAHLKAL